MPDSDSHNSIAICQVLHSLNVGGAEVLAKRIAENDSGGNRFVFACLDEMGEMAAELQSSGVRVVSLQRKSGIDFGCVRRLAQLCRDESIDVIHAHQYTPFFYSAMTRLFGKRPPILFTEHGRFYPDSRSTKRVLFNKVSLGRRDRVVGVGECIRKALNEFEGIAAEKIDVIYNGVDFARRPDAHQRERLRDQLQIDEGQFVVIQVARLDEIKDHLTAIRAIKETVHDLPNCTLLIVGDGPQRPTIEAAIRDYDLANHVRMLGTRRDVTDLLVAADTFLLTSLSEGIPVTILEAMGAELPVVSTDVGGVAEIVEAETGILVPGGDASAIANAIKRLARDKATRVEMGIRGRERALTQFTETQMHNAYHQVYQEMTVA